MSKRLREFKRQREAKARWDYVCFMLSGAFLASYAFLVGARLP